jgi:hypothetical protein
VLTTRAKMAEEAIANSFISKKKKQVVDPII